MTKAILALLVMASTPQARIYPPSSPNGTLRNGPEKRWTTPPRP
jgi:hypothetical protein